MKSRSVSCLLLVACLVLLATAAAPDPSSGDEAWHVVSFEAPIRSVDRAALDHAGARAVLYHPPNGYVALLGAEGADRLRARPNVAGVRTLTPSEKMAVPAGTHRASVIAAGMRAREVLARIGAHARVVRATLAAPDRSLIEVVVDATPSQLASIAKDPAVLTIGAAATRIELLEEATAQVLARNLVDGQPVPGYRAFLDALDLGGAGVTIAIADSGIDDTHPDLAGRVAARTDFTTLPDNRDSDGHGTHVAGIAAGSGAGLPLATDPQGLAYGMGVAPDATLVDVGVLGIIEETIGVDEFPPFEQASAYAVAHDAVGWNASWGSGEGDRAGYTTTARTMDIIARDADWSAPGAQPFILVFAAGNSGTAGIGAPAEAKNMIAVAASRSARAGDIERIAAFSSRGPALDGRIGPTVAAPGEQIVSTRSLPASVLCNTPPRDRVPMVAFYGLCSGTSMAAPHVTGAVALIAQWWRAAHDGATPSPAITKSLLVNAAVDMGTPDIPNRDEGWGRVDLRSLFDPAISRVMLDQTVTFDEVGELISARVAPADPSRPMKVTLAWSDAPAAPNAPLALVNDLDLRLIDGDGTVWRGNNFADGWSVPGGAADRREVLENVFVASPSGTYTIEVAAAGLPGDGVPFAGDATDQDFALVITNAMLVP